MEALKRMSKARMKKATTKDMAMRAALNCLIMGLVGASLSLLVSKSAFFSFTVGFAVGSLNLYLLIKTAHKGITLHPGNAASYVARRYPGRFMLTAALIATVLWKLPVDPLPFVGGLTVTLFSLIGTLIYMGLTDEAPLSEHAKENG